jgi:D-beta-D-heptose 7-phosphate kinase/D-beta-D-heptose 1-phosphate adenosyltransferase
MRTIKAIPGKIFTLPQLLKQVKRWRLINKKIVFTNGVFDILHPGHITLLSEAASFGNILIVGINSDASVKRLKGESRPVNDEQSRALVMAALVITDGIILFGEDTPLDLIRAIMPDVLIKGGDYSLNTIVGASEVLAQGGEVKIIPTLEGFSTTAIIEKMKNSI